MGSSKIGLAIVVLALTVVTAARLSAAGQTQPSGPNQAPPATPFDRLFTVPQVAPPKTQVDLVAPSIDLKALARRARFAGLVRQHADINCVASRALPADPTIDPSMPRAVPRTPRASARALPLPPSCAAAIGR